MEAAKEALRKEPTLKYSIGEGMAWGVMAGFGNYFITPFAVALKVPNAALGLLNAVSYIFVALSQPLSSRFEYLFKSEKKFIITFVFLHALLWLPLAFMSLYFFDSKYFPLLVLLWSLNVAISTLNNGSWRTWMAKLVDLNLRGRFFATRDSIIYIVMFSSIIAAGALLSFIESFSTAAIGFAALFFIAFVFRGISALVMRNMRDFKRSDFARPKFREVFGNLDGNFSRLAFFHCLFFFVVHIASAFFVVYQLNALKLSYFEFGLVAAMHPLASILTFKYWGKMIDKFGSKKVLLVAGILLTLNPILWLFANFWFLIFIELLAGFAWAGFNASSFTYSLQLLPTRGKTNYVAFTNSLDGMGIAIGAFASGFIADFFIRLNVPGFEGLRGLLLLFCLSGVLRLLLTFSFLPLIEPSRKVRVSSQEFLKVAFLYPLNEFRMSFNNGIHKLRHFRLKLLKK